MHRLVVVILIMALVMSGVPAAVAQQPPEFITIPDSWWFSTTEDYSLMGKEYRVRFYEDTESPDRTAIPVVTMLPDPTNPFQEVALSDEDELHAIALYALWRYYDRAYFRIDWWRHAGLWQVIEDTNDPAKMQRINFVLTSGKILFDLGLDMLFPLKVPKGLAQLQAIGRLVSITAELVGLIQAFTAVPEDNQLQAAIQASIDLDPSQLLTLDAEFDVREYLTRQRLEDTAPLEVIDLYVTALELRHFRNLTINVRGDTTTITVALKHPQSWIRAATILPRLVINRQLDGLQANAQAAVVSNQFHATVNVALVNALTGELAALSDPSLSPAELEAHVLRIEKLGFDFYWVAYEMMAVYLHYMRVIDSHGWVQQWVTPPKEALAELDQNVRFWRQSAKNAEVAIARIDSGYQYFLTLNYPNFAGAAAPGAEEGVTVELPISSVSHNADWTPVIQQFDGVEMVLVPPGCFMMGSTEAEVEAALAECTRFYGRPCDPNVFRESPQHQVCFTEPFWIDRYEVTLSQYTQLVGGSPAYSSLPVEGIRWSDASNFCALRGARLPSEAEWEYAARGPDSLIFPWGNQFVPDHVVYAGNSGIALASVGSQPGGASWVGAFDMSGNAWEWVSTIYNPDRYPYPYTADDGREDQTYNPGWVRVVRGGSSYAEPFSVRAAFRGQSWPEAELNYRFTGFRCARDYAESGMGATPVTPTPLVAEQPTITEVENGLIAFDSDRDGNDEIYVIEADGSNARNLTNHDADDHGPAWSPDGSQIAFTSKRDGNWEVYVMSADGTNVRRLTDELGDDSDPAWSPDGGQIVFVSERDGNSDIYVMNADGSSPRNLTKHPETDAMPAWSPDGTRILFTSNRDGNPDIYVMNADGSNPHRLTNSADHDGNPDWSPDSSKIAFERLEGINSEIYVMNADGSSPRNLTNLADDDGFPAWSPDGQYIVFVSRRDGRPEIYTMRADGSFVQRLTNNIAWDMDPDWQPVFSK